MPFIERYRATSQRIIDRIFETQLANIGRAADLVADVAGRDDVVYAFGSGHSSLVATEFCGRAGGLACFDLINDKTFGKAERLDGYARVLLDSCPIKSRDALIIVSNSGRNAVPVEMALEAQNRGIPTVAITSLDHSRQVLSRHLSGRNLYEICDIVIDTCCPLGDAVVELPGMSGRPVGATSTLAGAFIANCIVVLAASRSRARGVEQRVIVSMNVDEGDAMNRELSELLRMHTRDL